MEENLERYFREIRSKPLLNKEEERELAKEVETGNMEAKNQFIEYNLRLVIHVAKRYANNGVALSDLIQEGNIGLIKAVEKFDWRKGFKFSSLAIWYIRKFALRALQNNSRTVRVSISTQEIIIKIKNATQRYLANHDTPPSVEELANILDKPVSSIRRAQRARSPEVSLDHNLQGDREGKTILETLPNKNAPLPSEKAHQLVQRDKLVELMERELTNRERKIISKRYGLESCNPFTLDEVGEIMDLSGERVRQIQEQAESKIKKGFNVD